MASPAKKAKLNASDEGPLRPGDVLPTVAWPRELAFQLTPGARRTSFLSFGPQAKKATSEAKGDLDLIEASEIGFAYIIDNFEGLEQNTECGGTWNKMDVSQHYQQPDIALEDVKYIVHDNGDGSRDVTYISRHVCKDFTWPQMMDVYWDNRATLDTKARSYQGRLIYGEQDKGVYHTWLDKNIDTCWNNPEKLDRKDILQYGEKFLHKSPHGLGEVCVQICIDSNAASPHHWVRRDNDTHLAGSAMFDHTTKGWSNIYCVRHQSICSEGDIYDQLIKGMSLATEQQIVYGRSHSDRTAFNTTRCGKYE